MAGTVGVAPGTYTFQLPTGQTLQIEDWIDDKLFATVQLANTQSTSIDAFVGAVGSVIPGGSRTMTRVDTNIPRDGTNGLPMAWEMFVYGVSARLVRCARPQTGGTQPVLGDGTGALSDPPLLSTLFGIDRISFLNFFYNTRDYTTGTMQNYPQGQGFAVFSTNPAFEYAQNGIASPRDRLSLVLPIWLRENIGYKMGVSPQAPLVIAQPASDGGAVLGFADAQFTLWGLIKRSAGL